MKNRRPDDVEDVPRQVVGIREDLPPAFEMADHHHRRSQLLYAASGVLTVRTPAGTWVAPPEQGIWIPGGVVHSSCTIGRVQTRCVMIEPDAAPMSLSDCRVLGISPLLRQLLIEATEMPIEYDEAGRDGLLMRLLIAEIGRAPIIPLAVPLPRDPELARHCHSFLRNPRIGATIDEWAELMAMDRRRFTRLFRRQTGMSFSEWRQQACLSIALPKLASGEPVTMVALDLGYDSPASFSVMFKRHMGTAPSQFATSHPRKPGITYHAVADPVDMAA